MRTSRSCPSRPSAAPSSGSTGGFPEPARAGRGDGRRRPRRALAGARARRGDRRHRGVSAGSHRDGRRHRPRPGRGRPVGAAALRGIDAALERGAERVLLVPGDCPALDPAEVSALLAHDAGVVIVPDRHGAGTNALLLTPPDVMAPAFGEGSFARHSGSRAGRGRASAGRRGALARPRRRHARRPRGAAPRARRAPRAVRRAPARCSRKPPLLELSPLRGLPEVRPGDDLAALIAAGGAARTCAPAT